MSASTRIAVPGTWNLRTVAMPVAGGVVPPGRLYRSDALARLTPQGRAALAGLGVRRVVDLRSDLDRRLGGPDRLRGTGAELVRVPVRVGATGRAAAELRLPDLYRQILTEHGGGLRDAVRAVATADGPVLVHCTAGKDRTGLVVALVLLALGAEPDDVLADYAASEACLAGGWTSRTLRRLRLLRVPVTDGLRALVGSSPPEALAEALAWLDHTVGGVLPYLAGVGVGEADLVRLRAALVQEGA